MKKTKQVSNVFFSVLVTPQIVNNEWCCASKQLAGQSTGALRFALILSSITANITSVLHPEQQDAGVWSRLSCEASALLSHCGTSLTGNGFTSKAPNGCRLKSVMTSEGSERARERDRVEVYIGEERPLTLPLTSRMFPLHSKPAAFTIVSTLPLCLVPTSSLVPHPPLSCHTHPP